MKIPSYVVLLVLISLTFSSCRPYKYGHVFKSKNIQESFPAIVKVLELREGVVFADVGAQNGAFDAALATLTKNVTYYVQDIDKKAMDDQEWHKVMRYYSKQVGYPIAKRNTFHTVIGELRETKLPNNTFDVIHSNATFHAIRHKEDLMKDIYQKLKPGGYLFIRDEFVQKGVVKWCNDDACKAVLATEEKLMQVMKASGFKLVKKIPDFQGYPMYKFQKRQ
ncbi:MAG TPA: hypothetical protein DCS93_19190 [Microscillaceae bacterium]|nr:hypothetical protein [Microscillaceae bacterium]